MAGCGPTGDFGRPAPDLTSVGSTVSDDLAPHSLWRTGATPPNLTEPERELRNRAWYFLRRCGPYHALSFTNSKPPPVSGYYQLLVLQRPPDASWNKLADDIDTDNQLIAAFLRTADKVEHTDHRRQRGLWRPSQAAGDAAVNLSKRIEQNSELIDSVVQAAWFRLASFGYAADRLAIEAPSEEHARVKALMQDFRRTLTNQPSEQPSVPTVIKAGSG